MNSTSIPAFVAATPAQHQERQLQKTSIKTQYQHLLVQIDRRIQAAITRQDHCLVTQLMAEQQFLIKQI
jgi:hypothetical protein